MPVIELLTRIDNLKAPSTWIQRYGSWYSIYYYLAYSSCLTPSLNSKSSDVPAPAWGQKPEDISDLEFSAIRRFGELPNFPK